MATAEQLRELRDYISEPDDSEGWTDERLSQFLASATPLAAAARVWSIKASQYAGLVDVSESGSSRKLSDLLKNAREMHLHYAGLAADESQTPVSSGILIQRIRRGF